MKINKEDICRVKWDKEYIETISKETTRELIEFCKKMFGKEYNNFDNKGLTKEDCLKMCIEHDNIAKQKAGKHPLTMDQIKQNEINKEKQKNKIYNDQRNSNVKQD